MTNPARSTLRRYGGAAVAVLLATAVRLALHPAIGSRQPFVTFYLAVIFAAWSGGLGPSMLALGLGAVGGGCFLLAPNDPVAVLWVSDLLGFALFLAVGSAIVALGESSRADRRQLESEAAERRRTEDRLRDSERRFARFMQHLPGLAWIKDAGGRYLYANDAAVRAFRVPFEELQGRTDEEVFPPETACQFREHDRRVLVSEEGIQVVETLEHEDGVVHHSLVSKFPMPGPDDGPPLIGGIAIDITDRIEAEAALKESEQRLRGLMEQAPFSIQVLAPDGRTLRVNRAWEELWGLSLEDVAGYNMLDDPQLEAKGILPHIRRAFAGEPVDVPAIEYDPNETLPDRTRHEDPRRWVSAVAYPLKDSAGRIREVILVHEDITEQRRSEEALRESEARFRQLADTIPQIAWVTRPDGFHEYYNRRWYDFIGCTPEECLGHGWNAPLHPDDRQRSIERWELALRTGEPYEIEYRFRSKEGEYRWFLARAMPVRAESGQIVSWFGTCTDIEDLKRVEEALQDADRRKDEFLATLAHELRNPLAPVRNALRLMNCPDGEMEAERAMAERQVVHLARLIDDLMDVARISKGKLELQKQAVDLNTVARQAVETARPLIDDRRHRLNVTLPEGPITLDADPTRLEQVFWNLLNNAAKYTEPGGEIDLSVEIAGDGVVIRVRDTGIGIDSTMLPRLFQMFVQVDEHRDHAQGGLGIGLGLVRTLVELHGGTITAHSEGPGTGCEFVLRLPIRSQVHETGRPEIGRRSISDDRLPRRRILVVDDNVDAARSLARILARLYDQEVRVAHDGLEALAVAEEFGPEVVLLDIGLPGMDGNEVARRLRQRPEFERTLLVALTGWGQESDRQKSARAGFDRHLVKPVDPEVIRGLLTDHRSVTGSADPQEA